MTMRHRIDERGLTLLEVIIAMGILAILAGALVGVLPQITRTTRDARTDAVLSQPVFGIFERIGSDWSNVNAWNEGNVVLSTGATPLQTFVAEETDGQCFATIDEVELGVRKRVTITCLADEGLPSRSLRAEFGNPFGSPDE